MADVYSATIFAKEQRILGFEKGPVFGVRVDAQILPKGVWVAGYMKVDRLTLEVTEVLDPPYFPTREAQASWDACVADARDLVSGGYGRGPDPLIA